MKIQVKLLSFLLMSGVCSAIVAQVIVEPANQPIALTGILRIVRGYGPPGYGADKKVDVKISYWALELPSEINLACTPDLPSLADIQCGPTKRPRLFLPSDKSVESKARTMINKQVTVTGVVRRSTGMYRTTPIYVDVTDIALFQQKRVATDSEEGDQERVRE